MEITDFGVAFVWVTACWSATSAGIQNNSEGDNDRAGRKGMANNRCWGIAKVERGPTGRLSTTRYLSKKLLAGALPYREWHRYGSHEMGSTTQVRTHPGKGAELFTYSPPLIHSSPNLAYLMVLEGFSS